MLANLSISVPFLLFAFMIALILSKRSQAQIEYVDRRSKYITIFGTLIGPLMILAVLAAAFLGPQDSWLAERLIGRPQQYTPPLIWGIVAIGLWLLTPRPFARQNTSPHSRTRSAELHQRSAFTFAPKRGLIAVALLTAGVLLTTIIAGFASQPGSDGGYRNYSYNTATGTVSTFIYGWYWSVPSMITLAVLLLFLLLALYQLATPTLSEEREPDVAARLYASNAVVLQAGGAIALHLAFILMSLASTAGLHGRQGGILVDWTPFAALEPTLWILGYSAMAASFSIWSYLFLRALRSSSIQPAVRAPHLEEA